MIVSALPPEYSGSTIQALLVSKALSEMHMAKPTIIGSTLDKKKKVKGVSQGLEFVTCYIRGYDIIGKLGLNFRILSNLFIKRHNIDILHIHGVSHLACSIILMSKLVRKPVVIKSTMMVTEDPSGLKKSLVGRLKLRFLKRGDAIITICEAMHANFLRYYGNQKPRIVLIPNGVNMQDTHLEATISKDKLRKKLGLPTNTFLVTTVGAICKRKGSDFLVEAWEHFVNKIPHSHLVFVGPYISGSCFFDTLKRHIIERSIRNITFLGQSTDVINILRASDMFVFASIQEGLGTAQLEAMACGLPCVVTYLPGITDSIFTHGLDGLVIKDRDPFLFAKAMKTLVDNPFFAKQLGTRARQKVVDDYSLEELSYKYMQLYHEILRQSNH